MLQYMQSRQIFIRSYNFRNNYEENSLLFGHSKWVNILERLPIITY